ncbi:SPRY domain-containing protein 3-like isoform X2 [Oncorhynchus keta]|uniref:SPRY domain-containing protein 3-like isoform X2 n=1 Tax=Oncorhynchus keta TaxID=8018 RepID=UPI0015F78C41|nr:SPRY domain-containing protein 3-like isoform X2 [Oncorhynchus keta]
MDEINPHYRFMNWRRRIREVRAVRYRERFKRMMRDGEVLSYQGNSDEVGCYLPPRPLSKGNCYFEVTIIDTGVRGMIAVGLVPQYYKLDHQPGWLPHSVAYHADDGKLYNGNTIGQQLGPKCNCGDRIGCGIYLEAFEDGQTTVFTKNGKEVGTVVVPASPEALYPAVGMHSLGEEVQLDLQVEWGVEKEDGLMIVDSHEDEWGRLHDVRFTGSGWAIAADDHTGFHSNQLKARRSGSSGHTITKIYQLRSGKTLPGQTNPGFCCIMLMAESGFSVSSRVHGPIMPGVNGTGWYNGVGNVFLANVRSLDTNLATFPCPD